MKFYFNFTVLIYGILEGLIIFTGVYLLTLYYAIKTEHSSLIDQIFNNIDIYVPTYIMTETDENTEVLKKEIIDDLDKSIIYFNKPYQDRQTNIDSANNKLKKKFNTIYISIASVILFLVIIFLLIAYKNKKLKYQLYSLLFIFIMSIIIILFEFIYMKYIVNGYWYIHIGDILIQVINSLKN